VNGSWELTQPAVPRSDAAAIESLIARVNGLQMKSLAAAEPADLKEYGLDKPAASVRIGSGSSRASLLVGGKAEEGNVYAKDGSKPAVFTIEANLLEDLKKEAGEYRQKDLFDARAFNTTRIQVARGGESLVFEKTAVKDKDGKEEQKWKQTSPSTKDVDGAKVDALLSALTSARADSFVDKPAADAKQEGIFTLKFDEGKKEEEVTFLKAGSDAYGIRKGASGAAKLAGSTLDEIIKALDTLK
jgi:hypothetical protein